MNPQEKIIEKLQRRFQFLATIALFFPVLLDYTFKETGNPDLNRTMLFYGGMVAVLIVSYILLECTKKWAWKFIPEWINISVFAAIGSFALVLFIIASLQITGNLPGYYAYLFYIGMHGLLWFPIIILVLLLANLIASIKKS